MMLLQLKLEDCDAIFIDAVFRRGRLEPADEEQQGQGMAAYRAYTEALQKAGVLKGLEPASADFGRQCARKSPACLRSAHIIEGQIAGYLPFDDRDRSEYLRLICQGTAAEVAEAGSSPSARPLLQGFCVALYAAMPWALLLLRQLVQPPSSEYSINNIASQSSNLSCRQLMPPLRRALQMTPNHNDSIMRPSLQ